MRATLVTGGVQDYVEFTPETPKEATELVRVGYSEFHELPELFLVDVSNNVLKLRIYVSKKRSAQLNPTEKDELDQES